MPLGEFLQLLIELKVYSTADFITLKREEELAEGFPDKPLRAYPELQGKWRNLWDRVQKISPYKRGTITKQRKLNEEELETFAIETINEWDGMGTANEDFPIDIENKKNFQEKKEEHIFTDREIKNKRNRTSSKNKGRIQKRKPVAKANNHLQRKKLDRHETLILHETRKKEILALIAEDPHITLSELAGTMRVSIHIINKIKQLLKKEGRLARIGGNNNGYWEILEEGDTPTHYDSPAERKEKIISLITENPHITTSQLAEKIGMSIPTIGILIASLKQEGRLARIGTPRNGYLEVLERGAEPSSYDPIKDREEKILTLITENPYIKIIELSQKMRVSIPTMNQTIARLKQGGRLARIGAPKNGYWEALQKKN